MKKTLQFRRERPFVMVDYAVVMSGHLSVYELAVYLVLCAYADSREGTCFPSYQTIAGKPGVPGARLLMLWPGWRAWD